MLKLELIVRKNSFSYETAQECSRDLIARSMAAKGSITFSKELSRRLISFRCLGLQMSMTSDVAIPMAASESTSNSALSVTHHSSSAVVRVFL